MYKEPFIESCTVLAMEIITVKYRLSDVNGPAKREISENV